MTNRIWTSRILGAVAAVATLAVGSPSMTVTRAEAATMTMAVNTASDPWLECYDQCYVEYSLDMQLCQHYAVKYGVSSWEYETCAMYAEQPLNGCIQRCDAAYPPS